MTDGKLRIVTAASQNHARPLLNLLFSLDRYEPDTPVVVYDLGLRPGTLDVLRRQRRHVVPFRFGDYPPHVDPGNLRRYAWKPAIVHEMLRAHGLPLLWLDAGDLVHARLDRVRAEMARVGFYSPISQATIGDWSHPLMLEALAVEPELLGDRNRNGAVIGFGDHALGGALLRDWYEAAMRPEVICPEGSSTRDHRFDQAILGVLIARMQRRHGLALADALLGISVHNDSLSWAEASEYLRTGRRPVRIRGPQPPVKQRKKRKSLPRRALRLARRLLAGRKIAPA